MVGYQKLFFRIFSFSIISGFVCEIIVMFMVFVFCFNYWRCFGNSVFGMYNYVVDNGIVEVEGSFQFIDYFLWSFNVYQNVVCFVQFVDWVSQLMVVLVFQMVDFVFCISDGSSVVFDYVWNLFVLVRMDYKNDFVMMY